MAHNWPRCCAGFNHPCDKRWLRQPPRHWNRCSHHLPPLQPGHNARAAAVRWCSAAPRKVVTLAGSSGVARCTRKRSAEVSRKSSEHFSGEATIGNIRSFTLIIEQSVEEGIKLHKGLLDLDDIGLFTRGGCHVFALALHERFNYPIHCIPGHSGKRVNGGQGPARRPPKHPLFQSSRPKPNLKSQAFPTTA